MDQQLVGKKKIAQEDEGGGYVIRFQFEDNSKTVKYTEDEYSSEDGSENHFDTGNCIDGYPSDTDFEVLE
jgi:hypothetical protein